MADTKVGINVVATNNASGTLSKVKGDLSDLGKSAGQVNSVSSAFANLGSAVTIAGVAFGALKVGQQVADLAQLGASAQRLEQSFQTLSQQAGISSSALLSGLQKASAGTISNTDLMLSANKALLLGVGSSTEELTQLLEAAAARGKALGLSATQSFNDIVTGIGRESPLILDNLGIKVKDITASIQGYADAHGKVVDQLSSEERKRAIINTVIASSAELVKANASAAEDNATKIGRLQSSWENLKTTIGETVADSLGGLDKISGFLDYLTSQFDTTSSAARFRDFSKQLRDVTEIIDAISSASNAVGLNPSLLPGFSAMVDVQNKLKVETQFASDALRYEALAANEAANAGTSLANTSGETSNKMTLVQAAALDGAAGLSILEAQAYATGRSLEYVKGVAAGMGQITSQLASIRQGAISQLENAALEAVRKGGDATVISQQYSNAADSIFNMGLTMENTTEAMFNNKVAAQQAVDQYSAGWVEISKNADETERLSKAAARASTKAASLNQEFTDLASKVSGVLSGALSDVGGVDVNSILPRQDSVSEDARRLADVAVNGFASPWADYLSNKFPDTIGAAFSSGGDIKQTAAQLLKDFQDGLRPELLDKEKAKDLVRRAIVGEKNLKSLTDEIAKELAGELGVSVAQAQAAAVQALGGGGATGGASGVTAPKQVPIVPTIDTSKLPTTPISVKGEISSVTVSSSLTAYTLSIKSEITSVTIADTVTNPQIASTAAIGELVIADGAKVPTPVIAGGLSIDVVSVRSDAAMPTVILPATVTTVTLGDNVTNPQIASTAAIGSIVIAEGVTPPVPVLTGGLYIDAVALRSDVVLPTITLGATITAYSISSSATTEKPLALSARVTPFIDTASITDEQFVSAATFITESMPVLVTPQITVTGIDTSTALTYLESELAPIVTPYINYLGIPPEDLQAGGLVIGDGLKLGIVASNIGGAIVTEINKAQELIRSSGKTSGTNWGAGFLETVGQNVPSALVNLLVTLVTPGVLESIGNAGTRTGAQN